MSLVLDTLAISSRGGGGALFPPVSAVVSPGGVLSVMGPSGVGKSTLLDAIGGHLAPAFRVTGRIELNGRDLTVLPAERRRVGLMFQDAHLFPHLSVGDNLAFGLARGVVGRAARRAAVDAALAQAGLAGFQDRDPATLSGGQRARAALMRALLAEPEALLLDEPFARLDSALRADLRAFVFGHLKERRIPALMVTHDESDAVAAGGDVLVL